MGVRAERSAERHAGQSDDQMMVVGVGAISQISAAKSKI